MNTSEVEKFCEDTKASGFYVHRPHPTMIIAARKQKLLFGVPILYGARFAVVVNPEGGWLMEHVLGHPSGDFMSREMDTLEEVLAVARQLQSD